MQMLIVIKCMPFRRWLLMQAGFIMSNNPFYFNGKVMLHNFNDLGTGFSSYKTYCLVSSINPSWQSTQSNKSISSLTDPPEPRNKGSSPSDGDGGRLEPREDRPASLSAVVADSDGGDQRGEPPELPTVCCMSGCANCVWIEYAERLADHYADGGEAARREIETHVHDPSLRAFLLLELKTR